MTGLEKAIKDAQDAYYNGVPLMSDVEFDALWDKLKREQPDSELLKKVGEDHTDGFKKVKHRIIMGSQEKANTAEDMNNWLISIIKKLVLAQFKMDGSSLALYYDHGDLIQSVSRGDGEYGDEVSNNVLMMNHVVRHLKDTNYTGCVRGEVVITRTNKEKYFPEKANCRNCGNGIFKHKDGKDCDKLDVVVYDAQAEDGSNYFGTQEKMQKWLEEQGFKVAPYVMFKNPTGQDCIDYINSVFDKFAELEYDIDGIVWKQNEIDMDDFQTNYRPKTTIALKPARTYATSILRDVEWSCSNGTYTPVAIYDPVSLLGATVQRASLGNIDLMEQLGIEIGHEITICRCGEIIPKVVKDNTTGKFVEGYWN
jgi:DNA ligase (NAD+)